MSLAEAAVTADEFRRLKQQPVFKKSGWELNKLQGRETGEIIIASDAGAVSRYRMPAPGKNRDIIFPIRWAFSLPGSGGAMGRAPEIDAKKPPVPRWLLNVGC